MKDIIKKIVKERDSFKERLDESLDMLVELIKRYDFSETDEQYINELIERERVNEVDIEIDLGMEDLARLNEIAHYLNIRKEEAARKILEIELDG